ncbi:MAG: hypothetical protein AMJ46_07560 [Latescibacteria bacterium DG_63]|uniref:Uncharacterized protein n=2 Tax=Bacteria division TA06 TaxID=1156500 RepID=A0A0S8JN63_UNCT6|nr:MAG: hypothetical protein AMJ46_07560 [Latescibacteria bacterium DG_63]KPK69130.1 MAG: hypothetical protein AMJ82_06445 [candidate division TA06 bacterium SM23_40]KPL10882.1 MAG: hypothetical protein AMJ71_01405 [candidate division TA06 bacterium SM1_40]
MMRESSQPTPEWARLSRATSTPGAPLFGSLLARRSADRSASSPAIARCSGRSSVTCAASHDKRPSAVTSPATWNSSLRNRSPSFPAQGSTVTSPTSRIRQPRSPRASRSEARSSTRSHPIHHVAYWSMQEGFRESSGSSLFSWSGSS